MTIAEDYDRLIEEFLAKVENVCGSPRQRRDCMTWLIEDAQAIIKEIDEAIETDERMGDDW